MQIQLNTGKGVEHKAKLEHWLDTTLREQLGRFVDDVIRLEVHLSDESAGRAGAPDKRCTMEARMVRSGSVAVHEDSDNVDQAIRGALDKLKRALASRVERDTDHRDRTSIRTVNGEDPAHVASEDDSMDSMDSIDSDDNEADAAPGTHRPA